MSKMIMGAFATPEEADQAIEELQQMGYSPGEVSVISKSQKGSKTNSAELGAVVGATTGGTLGGITGLLTGIGVVPVLAGLFIAGPIGTAAGVAGITLTGLAAGAAAGGLIGALTGLGLPRRVAERYQGTIEQGGILVGVTEDSGPASYQVQDVLEHSGAQDISALSVGEDGQRYKDEPVIDDPRDYLVKHHMPVFGETLDDDYYDDDTL